jgi:lipopolysaccharide transport system ATP-binding protein
MYVRLAFAVAAHLEPEILIIDEVLAVGDAEFQRKCLGKMKDVSEREGRTVIFVSHNMAAIQSLCTRALLIRYGRIAFNDLPSVICMKYMEENLRSDAQVSIGEMPRPSDQLSLEARIIDQQVISEGKINPSFVNPAQPFSIKLKVKVIADNLKFGVQFIVSDDHQNLIMLDSGSMQHKYFELGKGEYEIECAAAPMMLYAGSYYLQSVLNIPNHKLLDHVEQSYSFSIMSNDPYNKGFNLQKTDKFGVFHVDHHWSEAKRVN